jgi:heptosyltransferase-2
MRLIFYIFIFFKRIILRILKYFLLFKGVPKKFNPDTVIVLKIGGLGDFSIGIPALNLLRKRLPNTRIILITAKSLNVLKFKCLNRDPLDKDDLPWVGLVKASVDEIIVVHDLSFKTIGKISALIPKSKNIGIFILGYPVMTFSSALKKLIFIRLLIKGVAVCVGIDKKLDADFMRNFQSQQGLIRHKMFGDIDSIVEGFPMQPFLEHELNFQVSFNTTFFVGVNNNLINLKKTNLLLLAPLATTTHKQWPLEKFVQLIQGLKKNQLDLDIVLVGTSDQFEHSERAFANIGFELKNFCGRLSIDELAFLFSIAKGYIGNDGGMSQLAGLVGCPSVIIFNSVEEDWVTHPWRSANGVIRNRTPCSPCFNSLYCPEGHLKCMVDITVNSVLLKVNNIIVNS